MGAGRGEIESCRIAPAECQDMLVPHGGSNLRSLPMPSRTCICRRYAVPMGAKGSRPTILSTASIAATRQLAAAMLSEFSRTIAVCYSSRLA